MRDEKSTSQRLWIKIATSIGLALVCIAAIGQTASLYLRAGVGITPSEVPVSYIGSFLWPLLIGVLIAGLIGRRKLTGGAVGLVAAVLVFGGAFAVAEQNEDLHLTSAWIQAELTPDFMRGLTKDQCMAKTINLLRVCDSRDCVMTMAGVMGDCVHFASGEYEQFCQSYSELYIEPNCSGEDSLSDVSCALLQLGYDTPCTEE